MLIEYVLKNIKSKRDCIVYSYTIIYTISFFILQMSIKISKKRFFIKIFYLILLNCKSYITIGLRNDFLLIKIKTNRKECHLFNKGVEMRINKYIALCGVASRRKAEDLILEKRVKVNNNIVTELSFQVDEKNDIVEIDGIRIKEEDEYVYILLNKPEGYITTVKDQFDRPSVLDLVKDVDKRVYPIGRLDYETSGLLLLTNDGDLTYKLTHPKHEVNKTYIAHVKGILTSEEINRFKNGLEIEDYVTSKAGDRKSVV